MSDISDNQKTENMTETIFSDYYNLIVVLYKLLFNCKNTFNFENYSLLITGLIDLKLSENEEKLKKVLHVPCATKVKYHSVMKKNGEVVTQTAANSTFNKTNNLYISELYNYKEFLTFIKNIACQLDKEKLDILKFKILKRFWKKKNSPPDRSYTIKTFEDQIKIEEIRATGTITAIELEKATASAQNSGR